MIASIISAYLALALSAAPAAGAPCMFDPSDGAYHACHHASMGECHHYGATCEPPGACMFNPAKAKYQRCHHASMGKCHHYGATCVP